MKSDDELLAELETLIAGLLFMSEADYPFQTLCWKDGTEMTEARLRELAGAPADAPVQTQAIEAFFRAAASEPDWKNETELALAKRYQRLVRWLKENLENAVAYRVGRIDIQVYIIGRSQSGNWIGVSTRVIET
jgi:hypothetical protein